LAQHVERLVQGDEHRLRLSTAAAAAAAFV
jgi:hypothetical protein